LAILPRLVRGTHVTDPCITTSRTTRLRAESDPPTPIHADGELLSEGVSEAIYEVLPGKLSLLQPA
jgi:diacylglycerol kinase family enzyme